MKVLSIVLSAFAAVAAVAVVSVAVTAAFLPGCSLCHTEDSFVSATAKGPHSDQRCGQCHGGPTVQSRVSFGATVVFGMALGVVEVDPATSAVASRTCRSCHLDVTNRVVEANGLRIAHKPCAPTHECIDCHTPTAHGATVSWPRTATMDLCYECHALDTVPSQCDLCHIGRLADERVQTGNFAVTHGPNTMKTHGMGDMSMCSECHPSSKCARCHGPGLPHEEDVVATHGRFSRSTAAQCTDCHSKQFCDGCHIYPMPHPAKFVAEHGTSADRDGQDGCTRCHSAQDCVQCHLDHIHPVTREQLKQLGVDPVGAGD